MADIIATPEQQSTWAATLAKFKQAAASVDQAVARLRSQSAIAARHPALSAEYRAIMDKVASAQKRITYVRNATAGLLDSLKSAAGLNGLGVLPLIPIAVVGGAIAYVSGVAADAWKFSKKLDEAQRLEDKGIPPQQAAAIVATQAKGAGAFSLFRLDTKWLAIGGVALVAAPFVWKWWKARR